MDEDEEYEGGGEEAEPEMINNNEEEGNEEDEGMDVDGDNIIASGDRSSVGCARRRREKRESGPERPTNDDTVHDEIRTRENFRHEGAANKHERAGFSAIGRRDGPTGHCE